MKALTEQTKEKSPYGWMHSEAGEIKEYSPAGKPLPKKVNLLKAELKEEDLLKRDFYFQDQSLNNKSVRQARGVARVLKIASLMLFIVSYVTYVFATPNLGVFALLASFTLYLIGRSWYTDVLYWETSSHLLKRGFKETSEQNRFRRCDGLGKGWVDIRLCRKRCVISGEYFDKQAVEHFAKELDYLWGDGSKVVFDNLTMGNHKIYGTKTLNALNYGQCGWVDKRYFEDKKHILLKEFTCVESYENTKRPSILLFVVEKDFTRDYYCAKSNRKEVLKYVNTICEELKLFYIFEVALVYQRSKDEYEAELVNLNEEF